MHHKLFVNLLLILAFTIHSPAMAAKVTLSRVDRPDGLYVGNQRLVVTQGTAFFLYTMPEYGFIGKFGRKGEGPGEFRGRIDHVSFKNDEIIAGSRRKVIFYATDGEYRREFMAPSRYGSRYTLLGEGFVGTGLAFDQKRMYQTISIYDQRLNEVKQIYRTRSPLQRSGNIKIFHAAFDFTVCRDRVFVTGGEDFHIQVFNRNGEPLSAITREYDRIDITTEQKEEVLDYFRTLPETRSRFDEIRQRLDIPSRFPAIRFVYSDDRLVYVQTYTRKAGKTEFFIYDYQGTFQKRVFLPVVEKNPIETNPIALRNNRMYQLVETPDEEWELRITDL